MSGDEYDYVTRTSANQGILRSTGFVNLENINKAGTWSLGLLQMDFFYRTKDWYAGQFIRRIVSKINIPKRCIPFFTVLFNSQKAKLLSVLVRDVDETFRNLKVSLPVKHGKIDFDFMESLVAELESQLYIELDAYLSVTGLKDTRLSPGEEQAMANYGKVEFKMFAATEIFEIMNTGNILSREIVQDSGRIPYLCASAENNSVKSYIQYDESLINAGNCVFIGGKTFVVSYQGKAFFSNDSHNLALYPRECERNRLNLLYLAACVYKSLSHKYSWGYSISRAKIEKDKISLPVKDGKPDYSTMSILISAVQKLVIKDVVAYSDKKLAAAKNIIENRNRRQG